MTITKGKISKLGEKHRLLALFLLIGTSIFLAFYFGLIKGEPIPYSHFFYLPLILAAMWYLEKALYLAIFFIVIYLLASHLSPVNITTGHLVSSGFFAVITSVVVFISTKRVKAEESLRLSFIRLAETVARAMESQDPYTTGHQRKVAELSKKVGEKMGLDQERLRGLYIAGLLHDIGKIAIPSEILTHPGKLTDAEWALIRTHPRCGYEILEQAKFPWPVADIALHHHEWLDGTGYPDGLKGDQLSLEVRILGVCDVVDAMSSDRPYRPGRSKSEVITELHVGKGTKYDPEVVDILIGMIERGEPIG